MIDPKRLVTVDWLFAASNKDLDDIWVEHGGEGRLRGPVAKSLDWPSVSRIVILYNGWRLLATGRDMRLRHVEGNLTGAAFDDRFKGTSPGGAYVLMLEYENSDRRVLVGFKEGVFLIESVDGIRVVDVRRTH